MSQREKQPEQEKEKGKKKISWKLELISVLICSAVGGLLSWFYLSQYTLSQMKKVDQYRVLSDAFCLPGLLFLMFGALTALTNAGALDAIGYMLDRVFKTLIPHGANRHENYQEYLARKHEKPGKSLLFLLITGALFLAVGLVFLGMYNSIYQG